MMPTKPWDPKLRLRRAVTLALLAAVLVALAIELVLLVPRPFALSLPDYDLYVQWGIAQLLGSRVAANGLPNYYPLPATLWIFVPLALLPGWFKLIWIAVPFVFTLWLFRRAGIILWLYYPMLIQAAVGPLDGWLLLPLYWLVENKRWLAGVGAVLTLFKPQLSIVLVAFSLVAWLVRRDWRNLGAFAATAAVLYLPAFVVDPIWPLTMVQTMGIRSGESLMATRGATLWAWMWHGGVSVWLLPAVVLVTFGLLYYVFLVRGKQNQAAQLLGLLTVWVLYAGNMITIIPLMKTGRQLIILTAVSWVGVVIDTVAGGWGGAYVILPLTALALLARDVDPVLVPSTSKSSSSCARIIEP